MGQVGQQYRSIRMRYFHKNVNAINMTNLWLHIGYFNLSLFFKIIVINYESILFCCFNVVLILKLSNLLYAR